MKNLSFRAMCFFAVAAFFVAAMMMTADGTIDGFWQIMQLFGGMTGIAGIVDCDLDHKKSFWYVFAGLVVAMLGSIVTAIIYIVMIALMLIICNSRLWRELNVMCKE